MTSIYWLNTKLLDARRKVRRYLRLISVLQRNSYKFVSRVKVLKEVLTLQFLFYYTLFSITPDFRPPCTRRLLVQLAVFILSCNSHIVTLRSKCSLNQFLMMYKRYNNESALRSSKFIENVIM